MKYICTYRIVVVLCACSLLLVPIKNALGARLLSSGCELQGASPGTAVDNLEWDTSGGTVEQVSSTVKRSGLASCRVFKSGTTGSGYFEFQFTNTFSDAPQYSRFYLYIASAPSLTTDIAQFNANAETEQSLWLTPARTLELRSNNESTVIGTYGTPLKVGKWYQIEWMYDSTGSNSAEVRLNGSTILTALGFAGNQTNRFAFGMGIDGPAATGDLYFDDMAVNSSAGTYHSTWPGAGSIVHLQPDGDGSSSGSGSSNDCQSGANWDEVEEVTPDDDLAYCTLSGNAKAVRFTVESAASAGILPTDTIAYVAVGARAKAVSNSSVSWRTGLRTSTSDTMPFTSALTLAHATTLYHTNGVTPLKLYSFGTVVDPATGSSFTSTGARSLDSMEIGIETVDGSPDIRVTTVWALVEYVRSSFNEPTGYVYDSGTNSSLYMTSANRAQEKGANTPNATGLGLGADYFVITNKLCLGGNPANCVTGFWRSLPAGMCQLETRKIYGTPTGYGSILTTETCMQRLSLLARESGWVATGIDRCSGGVCDASDRSSCVYTRLACTGSVSSSQAPLHSIETHTSALDGSLTYTPQCMDGVDNDGMGGVDFPADVNCSSFGDNTE